MTLISGSSNFSFLHNIAYTPNTLNFQCYSFTNFSYCNIPKLYFAFFHDAAFVPLRTSKLTIYLTYKINLFVYSSTVTTLNTRFVNCSWS